MWFPIFQPSRVERRQVNDWRSNSFTFGVITNVTMVLHVFQIAYKIQGLGQKGRQPVSLVKVYPRVPGSEHAVAAVYNAK